MAVELKLHGERPKLADQGRPTADAPKPDNVRIGTVAGTSAAPERHQFPGDRARSNRRRCPPHRRHRQSRSRRCRRK